MELVQVEFQMSDGAAGYGKGRTEWLFSGLLPNGPEASALFSLAEVVDKHTDRGFDDDGDYHRYIDETGMQALYQAIRLVRGIFGNRNILRKKRPDCISVRAVPTPIEHEELVRLVSSLQFRQEMTVLWEALDASNEFVVLS